MIDITTAVRIEFIIGIVIILIRYIIYKEV